MIYYFIIFIENLTILIFWSMHRQNESLLSKFGVESHMTSNLSSVLLNQLTGIHVVMFLFITGIVLKWCLHVHHMRSSTKRAADNDKTNQSICACTCTCINISCTCTCIL